MTLLDEPTPIANRPGAASASDATHWARHAGERVKAGMIAVPSRRRGSHTGGQGQRREPVGAVGLGRPDVGVPEVGELGELLAVAVQWSRERHRHAGSGGERHAPTVSMVGRSHPTATRRLAHGRSRHGRATPVHSSRRSAAVSVHRSKSWRRRTTAIDASDLNAFCHLDRDRPSGPRHAPTCSLPFGGVPIGVKELDPVAGWPYTRRVGPVQRPGRRLHEPQRRAHPRPRRRRARRPDHGVGVRRRQRHPHAC